MKVIIGYSEEGEGAITNPSLFSLWKGLMFD